MAALTLDASAALRILDPVKSGELLPTIDDFDVIYAPGLYVVETANALWKYVRAHLVDEALAARLHERGLSLIDHYVPDADLFPEAFDIACKESHPVYDVLYLLVARRTRSVLLTVDKRLGALAKTLRVPLSD